MFHPTAGASRLMILQIVRCAQAETDSQNIERARPSFPHIISPLRYLFIHFIVGFIFPSITPF
jgi:hypothetical protein